MTNQSRYKYFGGDQNSNKNVFSLAVSVSPNCSIDIPLQNVCPNDFNRLHDCAKARSIGITLDFMIFFFSPNPTV